MKPTFRLLKTYLLDDFPSGSSLAFQNDHLYVIGDDATHILILNTDYQKVGTVSLFDYHEKRIPKPEKTDFEACTLLHIDGVEHLLLVGSAATPIRQKICLIPCPDGKPDLTTHQHFFCDIGAFIQRLPSVDIPEVNIEGVCTLGDNLLLGNRGNLTHPTNHLIVTDKDFWKQPEKAQIKIVSLALPSQNAASPLGLSELCYIAESDVLLVALTSESTTNAYDDGTIGDSYLGWVSNASQQMQSTTFTIEQWVNLSDLNAAFQMNKIEGVCVASFSSSHILLHLIADNDAGDSRLFTLQGLL